MDGVLNGEIKVKLRAEYMDVFGLRVYILVATQFISRDDSFGRLQLCNLSHATECMRVCANRTIVTSQMNHHVI